MQRLDRRLAISIDAAHGSFNEPRISHTHPSPVGHSPNSGNTKSMIANLWPD
jgi:hypothetical protein